MKVRGKRYLLNGPGYESTAAIVTEVEDTRSWKPGCDRDGDKVTGRWHGTPDYTFQVSNCDRSISFELDFSDAKAMKNNLSKIDKMITALVAFRDGVADEQELLVARRRQKH